MTPGQFDHRFVAGDDYQVTIVLSVNNQPIDTSGYTFRAQVREGYLPSSPLLVAFSVVPVTGGATISLTAEQTRLLGGRRQLVWDFQSESPQVRTWLTGSVYVTPEVTND
jgi:hypothetical protein